MWAYFEEVTKGNDLSISGHHAMACFIAAAHGQMLESLNRLRDDELLDANGLRKRWYECMETEKGGAYRQFFFEAVKVKAEKVISFSQCFPSSLRYPQLKKGGCPFVWPNGGPGRNPDKEPPKDFIPQDMANTIYDKVAKKATKDLMDFITDLSDGQRALCGPTLMRPTSWGCFTWLCYAS